MLTVEEWLKWKVDAYNKDSEGTLEDMLLAAVEVFELFLHEQNNPLKKGLAEICVECNLLFLKEIGVLPKD